MPDMKKYRITLHADIARTLEIEADSPEQAIDRAYSLNTGWEGLPDGVEVVDEWVDHEEVPGTPTLVTDIEWDIEPDDDPGLPTEVEVPHDVDEDDIADYLSDKFAFLVRGFAISRN